MDGEWRGQAIDNEGSGAGGMMTVSDVKDLIGMVQKTCMEGCGGLNFGGLNSIRNVWPCPIEFRLFCS